MGFLRDAAGGWTVPFLFILAALLVMAGCGIGAIRSSEPRLQRARTSA
jgi:cyanate permease